MIRTVLSPRGAIRAVALLLSAVLGMAVAPARADAAAPGVSITMISSPDLTLDSNKPNTEGPQAAYVAFRIANTSGAQLTNLRVTLGGFANGINLGGTSSGNPQRATQYVGTLAAGASKVVYWFVEYPTTFNVSATLTATVVDDTPGSTVGSGTVATKSMLSAQAGGTLVSSLLGAGAVVGQTITSDIQYEYGGANVGETYNLQPTGGRGFPAGCFQLTRMEVVSSAVTTSPSAAVGAVDRPYFAATSQQTGSGFRITIRYFFKYLCAGVTTTTRPYGNGFSGGALKYSSNYDTFLGPTLPGATNPFTVTKTVSPTVLAAGGDVTYTIAVSNPSVYDAEMDSIVDNLPAGASYLGAGSPTDVVPSLAGSVPTAGAAGRIVWRGAPGSSFSIPKGTTFTVRYVVRIANTQGAHVNTASAFTGPTQLGQSASATVTVGTANLSVTKTGPSQVAPGDSARYVITVSNAGPLAATSVVVTDTIPLGTTLSRATGSPTQAGRVLTWPVIASLAVNATRTDTVVLFAPATAGTIGNVAGVSALTPDTLTANNRSLAESVVGLADLSVTKTASATVIAGDTVRYVITVSNAGPTAATSVVVTDTLPAGATFVRATGSPVLAGRVLTWPTIATLAVNAPRVDTVVVLAPLSSGSITNVAAGTTATLDTVARNNNGSQPAARPSTTLTSAVSVTPDGLETPLARLQNGVYSQTFTVFNLSPTAGTYRLSMRVTAVAPAGVFLTVDSVKGAGIATPSAYASASIPLAGRTQQEYTVWYRVAAGEPAVNTQFMRAQAVSDTLLWDDGFAEVARVRPSVTLAKSVSPQGVVASGTDLTYTMDVSNVGGFAARGVTVVDSVPDRVDFKIGSATHTLPAGLTATVQYLNAQKVAITPGAGTCSPPVPTGYDRCVRWVSWTVTGDLPAGSSVSAGQFRFVARIQ